MLASLESASEYENLVASCFSTAISNRTYPGYVTLDRVYPSRLPTGARCSAEKAPLVQVFVGPEEPARHWSRCIWLNTDVTSPMYNVFLVNFQPDTSPAVWFPVADVYFLWRPESIQADPSVVSSSPFVGATSITPGTSGVVPAPMSGDQKKVLSGAGVWIDNSSSPIRWDPPAFPSGSTLFTLPSIPNSAHPVFLHVNGQVMGEGDGFTRSGVNIVWTNQFSLESTDSLYFNYVPV